MGPCDAYSWEPHQICSRGFNKAREVHEATTVSQWHGIAINVADPLYITNLDRPIIYRVLEPLNLSRGMMVCPLP